MPSGKVAENLVGMKFNMLTVVERSTGPTPRKAFWLCRCDCGNYKTFVAQQLKENKAYSCGCVNFYEKHGMHDTRIYKIWNSLLGRCYTISSGGYKNYGGRGISVCDEWRNDFMTFHNWAMGSGYNDTLTIERIDVNGNYEPNNCKWITIKQQSRNKRTSAKTEYNGEMLSLADIADMTGLPYSTISSRYYKGLRGDDLIASHGEFRRGEKSCRAKLNEDDVRSIRKELSNGETMALIAKKHGINPTTVHSIKHKKTWWWVE